MNTLLEENASHNLSKTVAYDGSILAHENTWAKKIKGRNMFQTVAPIDRAPWRPKIKIPKLMSFVPHTLAIATGSGETGDRKHARPARIGDAL